MNYRIVEARPNRNNRRGRGEQGEGRVKWSKYTTGLIDYKSITICKEYISIKIFFKNIGFI